MGLKNSWTPLFCVNFLTVFNDNFLKWLVCFVSIKWIASNHESIVIAVASASLVLPFIFLSPLAGLLSSKYDKRNVMIWGKIAEVPIVIIGVLGFSIQSLALVLLGVFLLGIQSALISPSKYGLIREVKGDKGISFGTGAMEMLTFMGVLSGTFFASLVSDNYNVWVLSSVLFVVAVIGFVLSLFLKREVQEKESFHHEGINPITFIRNSYRQAQQIPGLNIVILGLSFFWLVGALIQMTLKVYCPTILHLTDIETGFVMALAAIGIGVGCFVTGILLKYGVMRMFVLIGAIGMVASLVVVYFFNLDSIFFSLIVFMLAFFAGMYKVPLNAWIQHNVKGKMLGDMLAYENICEFSFILISSFLFYAFDCVTVFLVMAVLTFLVALYLHVKVPKAIN